MIRVLLVDDEEPARERLRRLLDPIADLEIVGEAQDGEQAMESIDTLKPDLVLLDIQMPGCTGMELAASLAEPRPHIVFCTAFDEYAVDAFELHAVDYLLKPVNRARLAKTLERVRGLGSGSGSESVDRASPAPRRFLAKRGPRYHGVPDEEIVYFESDGGLTKLQTSGAHYWMQPSLTELEQRLDPQRYFRISRAAIVGLDAVREVVPETGGYGHAVMRNDTRLEISRRRLKDLMIRLGGDDGSGR